MSETVVSFCLLFFFLSCLRTDGGSGSYYCIMARNRATFTRIYDSFQRYAVHKQICMSPLLYVHGTHCYSFAPCSCHLLSHRLFRMGWPHSFKGRACTPDCYSGRPHWMTAELLLAVIDAWWIVDELNKLCWNCTQVAGLSHSDDWRDWDMPCSVWGPLYSRPLRPLLSCLWRGSSCFLVCGRLRPSNI